ncbi:MAG: GntR family transcriptional regulator YhfZ [Breznakia sp.]
MKSNLYSKNGLLTKKIAGDLFYIDVNEKIPRINDFCEKYHSGRGTVQTALNMLVELKAISIVSRGHLGSFLKRKNLEMLGNIAGFSSLLGAMPLPYSKKYEGLATAIVSESEREARVINMAFVRGSNIRLDSLKKGRYDFIIVSEFCAKSFIGNDKTLNYISNIGEQTYVSQHKIFFADSKENKIREGMKVGIDYQSYDQSELTLTECAGLQVELIDIRYMQIANLLENKIIDAAVLSEDDISIKAKGYDFTNMEARNSGAETTRASYVYVKERKDVYESLKNLTSKKILEIQKAVEMGEIMPRY